VVSARGAGHQAYRAPLFAVSIAPQREKLPVPSPAYTEPNVSVWLILSDRLVEASMDDLVLRSNRRPLSNVLPRTRTSTMFVYEGDTRLDSK
jgi:hypothetical protein